MLISVLACQKENAKICNCSDDLIGTWINPQYGDSTIIFEKSDQVPDDGYSLTFKSNQTLTERKNVDGCGTPPITYGDFDGSWLQNESIINIEVSFWGGNATYEWEIESLQNNQLVVVRLSEVYE